MDIDGAVDMASTLAVAGAVTVTGDTIKIDSATHAFYTADRGDASSYAINRYYTAGTENWRVGLLNDGTSNFHIYDVAGSADRLTINTAGNVGIGTGANIDEMLHVEKSSGTTLVKTQVASGSVVGYEITKTGTSTANWRIVDGQVVNGQLEIYDVTNSRSILNADSAEVVINDTSANLDFRVESDGNANALFVDASSNRVGILTASPSEALHVTGRSRINSLYLGEVSGSTDIIQGTSGNLYLTSTGSNLTLGTGAAIFNEAGADLDFRVESDTDQYALFVDGATGGVQMGGGEDQFTGMGGAADGRLSLVNTGNGHAQLGLFRQDTSITAGNELGSIVAFSNDTADNDIMPVVKIVMASDGAFGPDDNPTKLQFYTTPDASETIREVGKFDNTGVFTANYGMIVNETGNNPTGDFRVESTNSSSMLFVDAGTDRVGVGVAAPTNTFDVQSSSTNAVRIRGTSNVPLYSYGDGGGVGWATGPTTNYGELIYFDTASDRISLYTAGVERFAVDAAATVFNEFSADTDFRVESNGNANMLFVDANNNRVGIGTGAPSYEFVVSKDGSSGIEFGPQGINTTTSLVQFYNRSTAAYDTARFYAGGYDYYVGSVTNALTLGGSGVIANEGGSASLDFRVESDSKTHALFVDGGTNAVGINSSAPGATKTFADTSVAPNFHVDSDGFSNGPLFTYNSGGVFLAMANDVGSGTRYYITFGDSSSARYGDITSNGSVMTYGGTSDHRLKTNVQAISGSIDRVKNLNPVTFDWISSGINAEGFIAHEVQSVVPDAATGTHNEVDSNGKPVYQQIDPRHIVPLLTGALKEAITKIETLEARITALET